MNKLYYGDNLEILRKYISAESIDLIYLDPPFKSDQNYNILFAEHNGTGATSQIKAFEDTWTWDQESAQAYQEIVEKGGHISQTIQAFRMLLNDTDMLAYLSMMAPRLVEMRRVLKSTGSIYLHCDPTASHYLKLLMDAIFGGRNFRNEIIWHYKRWPAKQRNFQRMHDVLLFYSLTYRKNYFNEILEPLSPGTLKRWRGKKSLVEFDGKKRLTTKITGEDSQGRPADDVWDIPVINSQADERLGYPTQKPEQLLARIISASSKPGDNILDPFCGCGTAVAVAQRLKRKWVGIDITRLAMTLIKHRLKDKFGDRLKYEVIGEPVSLPEAQALASEDPYQFQWWALGLVGARPVEQKKGADRGIDGRLYFHDEAKGGKTKQIIFSAKAGHAGVSNIRDLRGVLDREKASIGVLISIQEPTKAMRSEAASAGQFDSKGWNRRYPRIQIYTIRELLEGKRLDHPPTNVTFKIAPKSQSEDSENIDLDLN